MTSTMMMQTKETQCADYVSQRPCISQIDADAKLDDYVAAVMEFDRLWESSITADQQKRMNELLRQIEAYESAPDL